MKRLYLYILFLLFSLPSWGNTTPRSPWIADESGVSYYDSTKDSYINIETLLPDSIDLPNNYLESIQIDNSGIWVYTQSTILIQFDPITHQINFWDEKEEIQPTYTAPKENKKAQKPLLCVILSFTILVVVILQLIYNRHQVLAARKRNQQIRKGTDSVSDNT